MSTTNTKTWTTAQLRTRYAQAREIWTKRHNATRAEFNGHVANLLANEGIAPEKATPREWTRTACEMASENVYSAMKRMGF